MKGKFPIQAPAILKLFLLEGVSQFVKASSRFVHGLAISADLGYSQSMHPVDIPSPSVQ